MSVCLYNKCQEGPALATGNFYELLNTMCYSNEEIEVILDNGLEGIELETFRMRAERLLSIVVTVPEQFATPTETDQEPGKCTVINLGHDADYYVRKLEAILEFTSSTQEIIFA